MCDCWGQGLATGEPPMDQRIESFLTDVLALAGESPEAVREGVRVALADCEAIFRAQETNKRMRDKAALACRARVTEELQRRRGTQIAEHLKLVRNFIDRPGRVEP
jgi:ethanolamine utilization microcompartment shell protein EutL